MLGNEGVDELEALAEPVHDGDGHAVADGFVAGTVGEVVFGERLKS